MQTRMWPSITELKHSRCRVRWKRKRETELIKKLKVWGEDSALTVGRSGRCVAAECVRVSVCVCVCGDESESELHRLKWFILRHLNLPPKPWHEKHGWRRVKKESAPTIYKTPIRKTETSKYTRPPPPFPCPDLDYYTHIYMVPTHTLIDWTGMFPKRVGLLFHVRI